LRGSVRLMAGRIKSPKTGGKPLQRLIVMRIAGRPEEGKAPYLPNRSTASLPSGAVYYPYWRQPLRAARNRGVEHGDGLGDVGEAVQAAPEHGGAGMAVACAPESS